MKKKKKNRRVQFKLKNHSFIFGEFFIERQRNKKRTKTKKKYNPKRVQGQRTAKELTAPCTLSFVYKYDIGRALHMI